MPSQRTSLTPCEYSSSVRRTPSSWVVKRLRRPYFSASGKRTPRSTFHFSRATLRFPARCYRLSTSPTSVLPGGRRSIHFLCVVRYRESISARLLRLLQLVPSDLFSGLADLTTAAKAIRTQLSHGPPLAAILAPPESPDLYSNARTGSWFHRRTWLASLKKAAGRFP